jgi:protein-S-isoprenylcysteine O-methyltransferase Ste14
MNFDHRSVIDCIWIILLIVWCLAALRASPAARRQPIAARLAHGLPLAVCGVLLFRSTVAAGPLGRRFAPDTAFVGWTGAMITGLGVAFAIAARFFLGKNWSGWVTVKKGHQLIRSGPYAVVRHPIYSGVLLGILGTAIVVGEVRGLVAVASAALGLRLKSFQEERFMEEEFGSEYRDYTRRVKAMIPLVW